MHRVVRPRGAENHVATTEPDRRAAVAFAIGPVGKSRKVFLCQFEATDDAAPRTIGGLRHDGTKCTKLACGGTAGARPHLHRHAGYRAAVGVVQHTTVERDLTVTRCRHRCRIGVDVALAHLQRGISGVLQIGGAVRQAAADFRATGEVDGGECQRTQGQGHHQGHDDRHPSAISRANFLPGGRISERETHHGTRMVEKAVNGDGAGVQSIAEIA